MTEYKVPRPREGASKENDIVPSIGRFPFISTSICLIIGNEGKGMSVSLKNACDYIVSIDMIGNIDSLNASVSCGILLAKIMESRLDE